MRAEDVPTLQFRLLAAVRHGGPTPKAAPCRREHQHTASNPWKTVKSTSDFVCPCGHGARLRTQRRSCTSRATRSTTDNAITEMTHPPPGHRLIGPSVRRRRRRVYVTTVDGMVRRTPAGDACRAATAARLRLTQLINIIPAQHSRGTARVHAGGGLHLHHASVDNTRTRSRTPWATAASRSLDPVPFGSDRRQHYALHQR